MLVLCMDLIQHNQKKSLNSGLAFAMQVTKMAVEACMETRLTQDVLQLAITLTTSKWKAHNSELYNSVASTGGMCSVTEMLSENYKTTNKMNSNC